MTKAIAAMLAAAFTALTLILGACQTAPPQAPPEEEVVEFDYSQPVPDSELMGEDWFDDSAIIGHSLIEGFEGYAKVDSNIHYFSGTGLSAAGALSYSKFDLPNGGTGTLADGLQQREFSKVYIMLGTNEIASSNENFRTNMEAVVDTVREYQGEDIPIYIISLTPTTKKKSDSTPFNLENTQRLNGVLQEMCVDKKCYYLDLFSCFADENGYLPAEKSTDGVHFKAAEYQTMAQYLQSHTVSEED